MTRKWPDGTKLVERPEDMSAEGKLTVLIQPDGDVCVTVREGDYDGGKEASVEFCLSGTRSPHTREALRALYEAMCKDELGVPWHEEDECTGVAKIVVDPGCDF